MSSKPSTIESPLPPPEALSPTPSTPTWPRRRSRTSLCTDTLDKLFGEKLSSSWRTSRLLETRTKRRHSPLSPRSPRCVDSLAVSRQKLILCFACLQFYLEMTFTELVSAVKTSFSKELNDVDEKFEGPDALAAFIDATVSLPLLPFYSLRADTYRERNRLRCKDSPRWTPKLLDEKLEKNRSLPPSPTSFDSTPSFPPSRLGKSSSASMNSLRSLNDNPIPRLDFLENWSKFS